MKIDITEEQAKQLFMEEELELNGMSLELHESEDWEDDGKYSIGRNIYVDTNTNKFYAHNVSRTGSYYSDYDYYYEPKLYEVEQVDVVKTIWMPK